VSPIFIRPVREQLEHDRLIRFLQIKYRKKFEVAANVGEEVANPLKVGPQTFFPDLILTANKKLAGVVEVESGESVNNLEAMAQWVHFAKLRVPFHLYVPVSAYDVARRLCESNQIRVAELWTYRPAADGFDLVRGLHDSGATSAGAKRSSSAAPAVKPQGGAPAAKAKKPADGARKAAKPKKAAKKPAKKGSKR